MKKSFTPLGKLCYGLTTFFYVGLSPIAPGTMGSLAALPFAWALWSLDPNIAWCIVALGFCLGALASNVVIAFLNLEDPQIIVLDEVIGVFITTAFASRTYMQFALAFALFRLFDIWKPFPIRWFDRNWKGGMGTMIDDLVAALCASGFLLLIKTILPNGILG